MSKLSKFLVFILFFFLSSIFFNKNVSAQTLNCKFSSIADSTCQIQFGLTCDPGKHMERECPLDCSYEGPIECISDSIPTPVPTPLPTDCFDAGGSCQPNEPSLCNGDLTISPQCNPQKDSTGSSYRCCKPPISTPEPPQPPTNNSNAFPQLRYPCDKIKGDEDFHSLRPYQAAHCGDANKARYCSNDLVFIETFDVTGKGKDCKKRGIDRIFTCHPDFQVPSHDLVVDLDDSMFPIMGNTEQVKNSRDGTEEFDDATKVNEYASWYLSGVNNRAEYGKNTDDKVVNFSGPVQKLLPKMIQEAERIKTIEKATINDKPWIDDDGVTYTTPQNHDQVVVCGKKDGLLSFIGIGITKPKPCYEAEEYRLSKWLGDLSDFNGFFNRIGTDIWNKRTPPLPWDDGTGNPFDTQTKYQKAYSEWRGESCALIPFIDINLCLDNPFVPNKWAELYQYIPLSNTTDKKGAEFLAPEHPIYRAAPGTAITGEGNGEPENAPLYFAHTQEVKELSELLNKTYTPLDCPEGKDCKSLENRRDYSSIEKNNCSAVNVRVNKGDDLFPGKPNGIVIPDVTYLITEAECKETYKEEEWCNERAHPNRCDPKGDFSKCCPNRTSSIKCTAQVYITLHTQTKTPNADEIFDSTVAGTGSTFRKIFPKVEAGAPVSCIKDIPTVTDVTYTATNTLQGGDSEFKVKRYPEDGAGDSPQLTFPHVGSVYEYFLKGIQTALRPKGYGEPIYNGTECILVDCGVLPELPKASGSCSLGSISSRVGNIPQTLKDIVEAAAQTYNTPPNLILAIMFGEGLFNAPTTGGGTGEEGGLPWSDYNVEQWATCSKVPNCNDGPGDDGFLGFFDTDWENIAKAIKPDLLKLDPKRINTPSRCNVLDAIYGLAWNLHDSSFRAGGFGCFGYTDLGASASSSCTWNDPKQYLAAIKIAENGFQQGCFTLKNSCATGGGNSALCDNGIDGCETISNRYLSPYAPSHMGCLWDVAHGN